MAKAVNALELLRRDHRHLHGLFKQFDKAGDESEQRDLCDQIVSELTLHTELEEEVFYPYLRETTGRFDLLGEARVEHQVAKDLMSQLKDESPGSPRFEAMVKVLGEYIEHHVQEEEREIFPLVEQTGVDLEALGLELMDRREGGEGSAINAAPDEAQASEQSAQGQEDEQAEEEADEDEQPEDTTRLDEDYLDEHGDELSRSTQHAKWIHSTDEHEDHPGQTLATRNHHVIRAWAEERGGEPATTANADPEDPHVLRFDFPNYDKGLQPIEWSAWLRTFDERELVFIYQEHMKAGNQSNFFRLDSPHREDG
ncbi:MAG TPA: hemerythrin domain-containing protein [Burkholderiaceae bacterium]|nr:hemerythrin domain-containing protein [Burkholderiaceae bacterium]